MVLVQVFFFRRTNYEQGAGDLKGDNKLDIIANNNNIRNDRLNEIKKPVEKSEVLIIFKIWYLMSIQPLQVYALLLRVIW